MIIINHSLIYYCNIKVKHLGKNINYRFFTSLSTVIKNRIHVSVKLSIFTSILFFKRYYPGGKEIGHASRILNKIGNIPPTTPPSTFSQASHKIIKEMDPTEIKFEDSKKEDDILNISNKSFNFKSYFLKLIPSIQSHEKCSHNITEKDLFHLQQKEAIYYFLNYFENLPHEHIKNTAFFMSYMKFLTEHHPDIMVRSFQLALEIYFRKAQFKQKDICTIFDNKFSIEDIINRNNGIADMSTFFSAMQTNHLYTQPGFIEHISACIVIATSLNAGNLKDLPPEISAKIASSKVATGNAINDVDLNGHHYDFKITTEYSFGRNHIIFINVNNLNTSFQEITKQMSHVIKQKIHLLKINGTTIKENYIKKCYEELYSLIENLQKEKNLSDSQKFHILNEHNFEHMHNRPHEMTIAFIIPLSSKPFAPNSAISQKINNIEFGYRKHYSPEDMQKAIIGSAIKLWIEDTKYKAYRETDGTLNTHIETD